MKAEDFIFAINETSDKFITEPFEENKTGKAVPFKKWAALAACICLILASATVVIAEVFDIKFEIFHNERVEESGTYTAEGYKIDFKIGTFPQNCVGEMDEMRRVLDYRRYGSKYGKIDSLGNHSYSKHFGNLKSACEYMEFYDFELPDFGLEQKSVAVGISGYSGEELTGLSVSIYDRSVQMGEPHIVWEYRARLYFDGYETSELIQMLGDEGETFSEERHTNENGIEYLVVRCKTPDGRIRRISAFLIKDNVLYSASMLSTEATYEYTENYDNPEDYIDFIHNWANFY